MKLIIKNVEYYKLYVQMYSYGNVFYIFDSFSLKSIFPR